MGKVATAFRPLDRAPLGRFLAWAMGSVFVVHCVLLLFLRWHLVTASRSCTAAIALLAGSSALLRTRFLPWRLSLTWLWAVAGIFLWALAHLIETFYAHPVAASSLAVDASDIVYLFSLLPLLMAFATTRETESLRTVFLLNCAQISLAAVLEWVLLYRMPLSTPGSTAALETIYGGAVTLAAAMSLLRIFSWSTLEERRCVRLISLFLWILVPIEVGMDYLSQYHGLRAGTLLDLCWSAPFLVAGWRSLTLPVDTPVEKPRRQVSRNRLLVECLCPLLMNAGIFVLAAAIVRQHTWLSLAVLFLLIVVQGLQAAVLQMNYLAGRNQLLDRELELRTANAALEELTLTDPLTGIANRRRFNAALEHSWRLAMRRQQPLALLMIDVDFFKGVNDLHGHAYGDECLTVLAQLFGREARRPDDLIARLGGEEFMLLLPDTGQIGAEAVAERLHQAIHALNIVNFASPYDRRLTVSIGLAVTVPTLAAEPASLTEAADRALYRAKAQGRSCTCLA